MQTPFRLSPAPFHTIFMSSIYMGTGTYDILIMIHTDTRHFNWYGCWVLVLIVAYWHTAHDISHMYTFYILFPFAASPQFTMTTNTINILEVGVKFKIYNTQIKLWNLISFILKRISLFKTLNPIAYYEMHGEFCLWNKYIKFLTNLNLANLH